MMILEARDITKIYGGNKNTTSTKALKGIDLQIDKGEFVGVMGPSGSGKTTLLNILSGMDKATTGVVRIGDKDIGGFKKDELALFRRRHIGFVFQDFNLLDSLSLKENIMLPMILDRKGSREMEEKVDDLMRCFDISPLGDKYPYHVSGGEQQRAVVARGLVNNPTIVFADEPTGNLDSKSSNQIMGYFHKVNVEEGHTILMVTHDPFAASFCKRIVFIKDGKVHMEIVKKEGEGKVFFDRILDCLAVMGGGQNEV